MRSVKLIYAARRGVYVLRWTDPSGATRQESTGTDSVRKANRLRAEKELELAASCVSDGSWEAFIDDYTQDGLAGRAPSTRAHWNSVRSRIDEFGAPAKVSACDSRWVSRFRRWLLERHPETTVASYLKRLRAALNWAVGQQLLAECPSFDVPDAEVSRGRAITLEEFERLLNAAEELPDQWVDPIQEILWGLWRSGLRLSELLDLHWGDSSHWMPIQQCRAIQIPPKKQKRRRAEVIPCSPEFTEWLVAEDEQGGSIFSAPGNADAVGRKISWCGQRAGVVVRRTDDGDPVYASAHDLRRSFATRWARRGMPEAMLAAILRHRSVETARVYYQDLDATSIYDAMERLLPPRNTGKKGGATGGATSNTQRRHAK